MSRLCLDLEVCGAYVKAYLHDTSTIVHDCSFWGMQRFLRTHDIPAFDSLTKV